MSVKKPLNQTYLSVFLPHRARLREQHSQLLLYHLRLKRLDGSDIYVQFPAIICHVATHVPYCMFHVIYCPPQMIPAKIRIDLIADWSSGACAVQLPA